MEKQPKGKLQPLKKEGPPQQRASFYSKESQLSRFKFSNTSERYKTEPSVENIREELPKKHSKNKTDFSEEYMSLVNKLRVNLSRQLDKKGKVEIVREREYLYNNENRQRNNTFVNGRQSKRKHPFVPRDPIMKLNKRSLTSFQRENEPEVKTMRVQESSKAYEISFFKGSQDNFNKESLLPSMNTLQKGRYQLNDTIKQVTEHNSPEKPRKLTKKKHKTSHKSKEKAKADRSGEGHKHGTDHVYEEQEIKEINESYNKLDELCFHIQILIDILESMNAKENSQTPEKMIRILKDYILGNKKYINNSLLLDDISHMDRICRHQQGQKHLRTMVFYERILIVYCIDLLASRNIEKYLHEISHIFHSFLGIYLYFLCLLRQAAVPLSNYAQACLETFQGKISEHNIHIKKEISTTVFFISKKLFPILKTNPVLFKQLKLIVSEFESRNVTINRSFYELLRLYAIYLNNNEQVIEKYYSALKTFATCPSPYLTKPPTKKYTLVLDLDETLIHSHRGKQKLEIFMRPFVKEFLEVMAKSFEIVIFTSSMPDYSEEIIAQLPFIAHRLYRYHTTRLKSRHVKDLSRLGRQLESVVMVDNEEENFLLQKGNGIKVSDWRGDNPADQQLNILGLFLNELAAKQPEDVREHLSGYVAFRKGYE